MQNNKLRILSAALLATTVLGLASCDEIEASLKSEDAEAVLINAGGDKLSGNTLGDLYDEIVKSGSSNSEKILENILYKLANSYFGEFYGDVGTGLYRTVTEGSDEQIKAYAEAHSTMFGGEAKKVKIFYGKIKESIDKSFFAIVRNESYQEHYYFLEKKFVRAQEKELYSFPELEAGESYRDVQVLGTKTYKDVAEFFQDDYLNFYKDYVERKLLPDVYRKALVEQHLIEKNRNALGRSNARKIQYIALEEIDGNNTRALARAYAEMVLMASDDDLHAISADIDVAEVRDLHFLDRLSKGLIDPTEEPANFALAEALYAKAKFALLTYEDENGTLQTVPNVYEMTSYGKLLQDYKKINNSRWADSSSDTDFTGGSAYTAEAGLEIQTNKILYSSSVTEGWFVSSGLSDLPDAVRTRLTKSFLANDLDVPDTHNPIYVNNYNGAHYLNGASKTMGDNINFVWESGSKYYIVRVDEAVKSPKLTIGGNSAYPEEKMDQIVADIAALIADGESYKKSARQYYIKNAALSYHDQDIYDYFESTFPDLF